MKARNETSAPAARLRKSEFFAAVWISLALAFAVLLFFTIGRQSATDFLTGYLTEESLSVDNLFVFVLVFSYFRIPPQHQHRVLMWGIFGAMIMRATMILIGAGLVPGDDLTGDRLTAGQVRRLACTAKILPAVLGGESLPLDLGRARRLFSPDQRKALLIRDRTCRVEGCDIPGTWSEAHHLEPWLSAGPTDLDNGILLCSPHHHRAHDAAFRLARLANGDVRFHRRR